MSWDAWSTEPQSDEGATWGDYGKALGTGAANVASNVAGGLRYFYEQGKSPDGASLFGALEGAAAKASEDLTDSMTKEGRDRMSAAVTSDKFWEHPLSSSALKATGMAPMVVASVLPGALIADATMALAATAAAGGALNAAGVIDEIYKKTDAQSDEDLKKASDYYAGLRATFDEKEARRQYNETLMGLKPAIAFAIGAGVGAVGPAAKAVQGLKAGTGEGVLRGAATGAAEGATGLAAQSGSTDYMVQSAEVKGGLKKDIDKDALVNAVLEGGAFGAAMGGVAGAVAGRGKAKAEEIKAKKAKPAKPEEPTVTPEVKPEDVNQQPKNAGTGNQSPPVETAPVGDKQNAVTRSETQYPKAEAAKGQSRKKGEVKGTATEVVEAGTPSTAEAAAITDLQQKTQPEPKIPEVPRAPEPPPVEAPPPPQEVAPVVAPASPDGNSAPRTPEVAVPTADPVRGAEAVPARPIDAQPSEVRRAPRILRAIKDKAALEAEAKAAKEAFKATEKNARAVAEAEQGEPAPKGKNWTKKELEERNNSAEKSRELFDRHVPENDNIPTTPAERAKLRERLGAMLAEAKESGVKIPVKVGYEGTADHIVYLRDAADLHKKLGQKSFTGARATKQITDFMIGERAAKQGDFSVLRERRKVEGDVAKRVDQGNVEERGAISAPDAEKEPVITAVPKSARGAPRMEASEEKPASAGRKLEGAEKAKAIAELNARMAKGKVDLAATRTAEPPKPEPKPIPKATSDAAVTRAGKKTNVEPTDAQKEAGNYAKGTVEWNGMHIAIENPKGSVRKGDGWSTEMQDHYGYVKRTKGADGDQVDVFMGPNPKSDHVWVIHQQDFNGNFDEHKAMLGFNDRAEAMQAYDRAFSDGRGIERIKDMESMSAAEFKDWVNSDKPKKAKKEAASIDSALKTDVQSALNPSETIEAIHSSKAADVLRSLKLEHLAGVPKAIADLMRNRLTALVGDIDVHVVSKEELARAAGDLKVAFENDGDGTIGLHRLMMSGENKVLLRADALRTPEQTAHVTIHEIAHAATVRAVVEDPQLHRTILDMMGETKRFLEFVPDIREQIGYALTDPKEFIAEAFSNPKVQEILAQVPMSAELNARTKLGGKATLWDAFVSIVRKAIEKTIGPVPEGHRIIEGILRLGNSFERHNIELANRRARGENTRVEIRAPAEMTSKLVSEVKNFVKGRVKGEGIQEQETSPRLLSWRTMDQLAQAAQAHFRDSNPVRRIADVMEMMRVKAATYLRQSDPILDKMYTLEKKYKGEVWDNFTALVHDETMANVHADRNLEGNSHLGKDVLGTYYSKELHGELAKRWEALPDDLKAARTEALKAFADRQNTMSLWLMKNRVREMLGRNDDELARRIHEGRTLDTDADLLGGQDVLDAIKEVGELSKIEGPYVPLIRRGDYVVHGEYDVPAPKAAKSATKVENNVYDFKSRNEAIEYEKQLAREGAGKPTVKSRWVDKNTGEKTFPDGTRVTSKDIDAEQIFRVAVQNKHVEMFESLHEAQKAAFELAQNNNIHVHGVEQRKFEYDNHSDLFSREFQNMVSRIRNSDRFKDLDKSGQAAVISELHQAALRSLGSTRVQSKRLPRRYVEGASKDFTRNMLEYMQSSSGYLAKLEHQPQLEAAIKEMDAKVRDDEHKTSSIARSSIAHEVHKRIAANETYDEGGAWNGVTKRIMTLSFLDKLAGPSHNIINSLQPAMVTFPTLAGRYGVGKSFDALSRAYRDISGLGIVKAGLKDTIKKVKDGAAKTTDLLGDIKKNLTPKEREMVDYLAERGSIDPDAGFEIDRLIKARDGALGKLDSGLGYFEGVARQMPQAIEMMNRAATAVATYRLEMGRGASHEKAMRAAQESVNNTQGLYSNTNAPGIFKHPVAKLSLQFKKYGQMMYHLLGSNIGKAIRNAEPGDRAEALKTLAGLTATHVAMAGALGLPTEPFKYLLLGAQAAGLTSTGWSDVENKVRETATNYFGKTGGELLTKGLPRALGFDLSSRVGLDSLSSFAEPKSNKDSDVKSWMFDTLAGAPVALVGDWVRGMNALTAGEFTKAAELLVPMKFAADSIKAYRLSTEGKKGSTGKETMEPYSFREAATRAIGFTPAREAEEGAKRSAFYRNSKQDTADRSALMTSWVTAKPAEKLDAWKKIQSFNKNKAREEQISMSDLTRAADRRRKEGDEIKTTKRDKRYLDVAERTYNP